jgi:hypothetical protein
MQGIASRLVSASVKIFFAPAKVCDKAARADLITPCMLPSVIVWSLAGLAVLRIFVPAAHSLRQSQHGIFINHAVT